MSTNALTVINEAAEAVGDPGFKRISRTLWRTWMNASARDMARKTKVVLWTATFDIEADEAEYALPDDCIQIKSLRYNDTPSVATTWRWLEERFEDEFRTATQMQYPQGTPTRYFADAETFWLIGMPDTAVTGGGKITYWGLPDEVTNESVQGIPVRDFLRDTLRDRMVIYGLRNLEKFESAASRELEWQAALSVDREVMEDRSADRRPRIRARSAFTRITR